MPSRALFAVALLVPQPSRNYNHQHQPAQDNNHGRLRLVTFFCTPDRRRDGCRGSPGDDEEEDGTSEKEEERHHLDLLQATLALATSKKKGSVATA